MPIDISIDHDARFQLATQQLGHSVLREVTLTNKGADTLHDLRILAEFDPAIAESQPVQLVSLGPGETVRIGASQFDVHLSTERMVNQTEREAGTVAIKVFRGDDVLAAQRSPVEILAYNEWVGVGSPPEIIASFVTPNHPDTSEWLKVVRDELQSQGLARDLEGYQSRDTARVAGLVAAIYRSVKALGIDYASPPASFEKTGQKVRTLDEVRAENVGTCLDLTLTLASLLEKAGLNPLIIVIDGHAFPAVWLTDFTFPTPWVDDPLAIRKRIQLGECLAFDSSAAAQGVPFKDACDMGVAALSEVEKFIFAVDVTAARKRGVHPLNLQRTRAWEAAETAVEAPSFAPDHAMPFIPQKLGEAPEGPVEGLDQLGRWKSQLLDLSLRNRLINHRDTNSSIPLLPTKIGDLEDLVVRRKRTKIIARPNKTREDEDFKAYADEELASGRIITDLTEAEFQKRAIEVYRSSVGMMRDSGTCPLYLTLGMLEWYESDSSDITRRAPIILMPVELERDSVNGPFYLVPRGDEPMLNVTLVRKLEQEFGTQFPRDMYEVLPTDESGIDVDTVLRQWLSIIVNLHRFDVKWEASVSIYNFQKFLMWMDLEQNTAALQANSCVQHLLTDGGSDRFLTTGMPNPDGIDDERPREADLSVVESDSSQLSAVFSALDGNSFVLQGPPGTGKSQTITNLIAQALGGGKTVLFVSEKRAALEVVESRLKNVGLGPFTLEVHSDKASKSEIVKQLEEPFLYDWNAPDKDWSLVASQIEDKRRTLNAHVERMHRRGPFGDSIFQAVSRLCALRNIPRVEVEFTEFPDERELENQRQLIAKFQAATKVVGVPHKHIWAPSTVTNWTPDLARDVETDIAKLAETGAALTRALDRFRDVFLDAGARLDGKALGRTTSMVRLVNDSPAPPEALLQVPFAEVEAALASALPRLREYRAGRDGALTVFQPSILDENPGAVRAEIEKWRNAFFLIAFFMLFFVRRRLKPHAAGSLPDNEALSNALASAQTAASNRADVQSAESTLSRLFGHHWRGLDTEPEALENVWDWTKSFRRDLVAFEESVGPAAAAQLRSIALAPSERLVPGTESGAALLELHAAQQQWSNAESAVATRLEARGPLFGEVSHADRVARIQAWRDNIAAFRDWCDWRFAAARAKDAGFEPIVERTFRGELVGDVIGRSYERALRQAWFEYMLKVDPELGRFRGSTHEQVVDAFRAQDSEALELARREIQARLAARLPDRNAPGEMEVLRREFKKQRAHKPLRKLYEEVPSVLLRLKPCVLMSPLSVARFLDPNADLFDLVVFDEASQIPPWDAIGALGRAKQAIVVGDSKQLPPTSFFSAGGAADDDLLEEDQVDMESILDQCVASGMPEMTLNWHYRSRHENLIAFSNYHYYDNRLHIFPSPHANVPELGVRWVHVADGYYDRGASRTNRAEAKAVVDEIVMRLRDEATRDATIGVVTFSQAQQKCVEDLLDRARQQYPEIEKYFGDGHHEPVFVKNLENVQGDERDVMFFSIGYGPDQAGKVAMAFGPLNKQGGERRLNVAVTRARQLLTVFSTLRADQIDLSRTNAIGVKHLKRFLEYAERGPEALAQAISVDSAATFESPLEREIAQAIEAEGWQVQPQVGVAGYRIDLAVVHPEHKGAYILGIEADGAAYHSSKSARDRDRLRQSVLEGLGWSIHRVWSTDWWHDPKGETGRILEAIRRAHTRWEEARALRQMRSTARVEIPDVLPPKLDEEQIEALAEEATAWPDYATPWTGLPTIEAGDQAQFYDSMYDREIARMFGNFIQSVQPIPAEVAAKHFIYAWDFRSASSKAVDRVLDVARASGLVTRVGDDLWATGNPPDGWRGFRYVDADTPPRDFSEVADAELECVIKWVVGRAIGVEQSVVVAETARVFGNARAGKRIRERVESVVDRMVGEGALRREDEKLKVVRRE